ncbi:MAG: hypothetical protein O3A46_08150, partial [Candidatus Poribacteria bacterium]|nr:hypothetical protein [Candidatus Poribacteria bacterium]
MFAELTDGLILYLPMNRLNADQLRDYSPTGTTATVGGGVALAERSARFGNALNFRVSEEANARVVANLGEPDEVSFSFHVYADQQSEPRWNYFF